MHAGSIPAPARRRMAVSPNGTSWHPWHYRTEPSFPSRSVKSNCCRIPGTASEAGVARSNRARVTTLFLGPFRTHGLQIIPETSLTLSPARRDSERVSLLPTAFFSRVYRVTPARPFPVADPRPWPLLKARCPPSNPPQGACSPTDHLQCP